MRIAAPLEAQEALGRVDDHPSGRVLDHEHDRYQCPTIELEQVGGGVGDHRNASAGNLTLDGDHLAAHEIVDPQLVGIVEGLSP
jgi:hypothetical protein